jgi:hypothetical protein
MWQLQLFTLQSRLHISVGRFDQLHETRRIDITFGPEFHMAHELAGAFQQVLGISKLGAAKEADMTWALKAST